MEQLKKKIELELQTTSLKSIHRKKIHPMETYISKYQLELPGPEKPYYMITFTFGTQHRANYDEQSQFRKLEDVVKLFNEYQHYSCFEKHADGVLHCHMLIICDHSEVQPILHKAKKLMTTSKKLEPAIMMKAIKKTKKDIEQSFDYIIRHKEDHPKYKYLTFNI